MTDRSPAPAALPIDLVALDMAGTTVAEGGRVYDVLASTVAEAAGRPVPHDLLVLWKGTSKRAAVAGLLAGLGEPADDARVDALFEEFNARLIASYRENPATPIPGVPELFATLRAARVRVALQTGYSADVAAALFEGLGWSAGGPDTTVDTLVTSDLVPASRPAPYLVFRCMEATGVTDVRRVLVGGDTPNDLAAGHHAGAGYVVGVGTGSFALDRLAEEPHTALLGSVTEIPALIGLTDRDVIRSGCPSNRLV